ncbi:helix-turn-helix transcriptional regulator [Falsiroseomonas ponticola]|uniref:helix-turn-helix transcriptional regulator n=1 Tax=Falsiroseomonas ponticola TaxID=2786951 RepID=UPI001931F789|nr:AraC family transcriptional regulator [Roseomonas ponticola]
MPDQEAPGASVWALYQRPPLSDHVRLRVPVGGGARLMEIAQPPGDYGTPGAGELVLVQPQIPGIRLRKVWGEARFEGTAPQHSLWLVAPGVATALSIRTRHVIRTLSIPRDGLAEGFAPGRLAAGPFASPVAHHLLRALWHAAEAPEGGRLRTDGAVAMLVGELARLAGTPLPAGPSGLAPWQLRAVTEAIAAHPGPGLSLAELAALARLSPFHFARAFRRSLGVSPHQYQKRLRVERAAAMLAAGRASVLEVALAVGYESGQALARAFRQEMGVGPAAWRRDRQG